MKLLKIKNKIFKKIIKWNPNSKCKLYNHMNKLRVYLLILDEKTIYKRCLVVAKITILFLLFIKQLFLSLLLSYIKMLQFKMNRFIRN